VDHGTLSAKPSALTRESERPNQPPHSSDPSPFRWSLIATLIGKVDTLPNMADDGAAKKRTFRKFSYRGVDLDQLLDMKTDELVDLFAARARRRYSSSQILRKCNLDRLLA
jgi:hypothetical protein